MFQKVEHVGVAVQDAEHAQALFTRLSGVSASKSEEVAREGVTTVFFQIGETQIELLEATKEESAIARFLSKKGEGIHHLAFLVDDIRAEMARVKAEGFQLLSEEPLAGADNKLICFLHPKSTLGILVELCQEEK